MSKFWRMCMCQKRKSCMWTISLQESKIYVIFPKWSYIACSRHIFKVTSIETEKQMEYTILWSPKKCGILKESNHPPNRGYFQSASNLPRNANFFDLIFCKDLPLCVAAGMMWDCVSTVVTYLSFVQGNAVVTRFFCNTK